jgi:N-acylneuraminate cytidylyltransferase
MSNGLAIIPARGGSKGIPRKNVLPLAGKPLIAWTIEAAKAARRLDRVVVSTDDAEIAAVAQRFGAEVVQRPAEISGDSASSEAALLHVLGHLRESEGYQPEFLTFLQCTSPLTAAEDIDGTIAALLDEKADTAVAVTPFHYFLWRRDTSGEAVGINHDKRVRLLRQQREPEYLETGAVYVMRVPGFLETRHRFFGQTAMYVIPPERRWEIDEPVDFRIAELLLREQQISRKAQKLPRRLGAIALDFDGVFTDNLVFVFEDGREAVACNRSDGWGLASLRRLGWPILVVSTEVNPVVAARCAKLRLDCVHGVDDKVAALKAWLSKRGLDLSQALFVGNDVNDLPCLKAVGCPVVVADAHPEAMRVAQIVLNSPGGRGALRELAELVESHFGEPNHVESGQDR